jgi:hypothetical protein
MPESLKNKTVKGVFWSGIDNVVESNKYMLKWIQIDRLN